MSVCVKTGSASEFALNFSPLYSEIIAGESIMNVLNTKVEIKLRKKVDAVKWPTLEGNPEMEPVAAIPTTPSKPGSLCVV